MWYIKYVLHIPITHSLLKSQSQMCSKLHQLSCKKRQWIYVQDKLGACFNKQKGKKNFTFPIFESNILNKQNVDLWGSYGLKQGNSSQKNKITNKIVFFFSYFIVLLNVSKILSKVRSFEIKRINCQTMG